MYVGFRLDDIFVLVVARGRRQRFFRVDVQKNLLLRVKGASGCSSGRWFCHMNLRKNILPHDPTEEPSSAQMNRSVFHTWKNLLLQAGFILLRKNVLLHEIAEEGFSVVREILPAEEPSSAATCFIVYFFFILKIVPEPSFYSY